MPRLINFEFDLHATPVVLSSKILHTEVAAPASSCHFKFLSWADNQEENFAKR